VYVRYTRRGTAVPCPYTSQYNVVPHLNGNRYTANLDPLTEKAINFCDRWRCQIRKTRTTDRNLQR
ncbi:MAG: hypothetical protein V7K90_09400, partial [Nostoc sp.]|uniref:hypothetical protein n=1 Tax=Nostoc sp. TaxID=1180 RepID=UPI002FFC5B74